MYSLLTADVEKRITNFEKTRKIGEGTYGEVYEAFDKTKNIKVALKRMRIENKEEGIPITALREMCILKHIKHENIVELYDIIQDIDKIYLIFEYVEQDLKMFLDEKNGIKDINIIKVRKNYLNIKF
jgi:serine/threonine protein kinase